MCFGRPAAMLSRGMTPESRLIVLLQTLWAAPERKTSWEALRRPGRGLGAWAAEGLQGLEGYWQLLAASGRTPGLSWVLPYLWLASVLDRPAPSS